MGADKWYHRAEDGVPETVELPSEESGTLVTKLEERRALVARLKERFSCEDLDDHVHELKSREASGINNGGIDAQIAYLIEEGGADWVRSLLEEETPSTSETKS